MSKTICWYEDAAATDAPRAELATLAAIDLAEGTAPMLHLSTSSRCPTS